MKSVSCDVSEWVTPSTPHTILSHPSESWLPYPNSILIAKSENYTHSLCKIPEQGQWQQERHILTQLRYSNETVRATARAQAKGNATESWGMKGGGRRAEHEWLDYRGGTGASIPRNVQGGSPRSLHQNPNNSLTHQIHTRVYLLTCDVPGTWAPKFSSHLRWKLNLVT